MEGRPVTIRFLDPPLHEFVRTNEDDIAALAKDMKLDIADLKATIAACMIQPMMGHRGCRLAVTYPEIYEMQTRPFIQAAYQRGRHASGMAITPGDHDPAGRRAQRAALCEGDRHRDRRRDHRQKRLTTMK
jgi:pyruvate,orthophosphate dikinase